MFAFCYSIVIKILRQWSYVYSTIYNYYKNNCKSYCKLCIWHVCLWEPLNPGSKDISYSIPRKPVTLWMSLTQWDTGTCNQAVLLASFLTSFAPRVVWRSWQRLVVPELIYSNDLTDEILCIFWFTEFRLCLPVWIRQTSYVRIIPRYHTGAFSVQGWKADLVAGGTSCSFLREQHCHFLEQTRYYNSLHDL